LSWFRDKWTDVFVEFVTRWPTLLTAQRARRETLVAFFHEHNVRRAATVERRLEAIKTEKPLTTDRAVIEPAVLHVQALLAQLRELNRSHTSTRKSHNAAPSWLISNSSQLCLVPDPVWPPQGVS
jgi:hypothetical protein